MLRYCVAFIALSAGGLGAVAELAVRMPMLAPEQLGGPEQHTSEKDQITFDAIITCYGIAYPTGRLLYRWWGAHAEAEELRRWSQWHLALLNLLGGCWLIRSGWQPLWQAHELRPSFVVGVLMAALTAYSGLRGLQDRRGTRNDPTGMV
jgi:hypothetical protein